MKWQGWVSRKFLLHPCYKMITKKLKDNGILQNTPARQKANNGSTILKYPRLPVLAWDGSTTMHLYSSWAVKTHFCNQINIVWENTIRSYAFSSDTQTVRHHFAYNITKWRGNNIIIVYTIEHLSAKAVLSTQLLKDLSVDPASHQSSIFGLRLFPCLTFIIIIIIIIIIITYS